METDCKGTNWEQGRSQELLEFVGKNKIFLVFPYIRGKYGLT